MPPFTRIAEGGGRKGRRRIGQTERRGDVTQTASPSLLLSLPPLRGRWNAQISLRRRRPRRRWSLLFHSIGEMSDTIQIAATLPPAAHRTSSERGREKRRGRGRRHLFHGPLLCEARFSDHSFILLASQPSGRPACQQASERGPPAHNGVRESIVASCCSLSRYLKYA